MKSVLIMSCDTCAPRIAESIARGLESQGKKAAILAPVASCKEEACGNSVCERQAAQWIAQGKRDQLISLLIDRVEEAGKGVDVVVIRPIKASGALRCAYDLNVELAKNIDAAVLPAICADNKSDDEIVEDIHTAIGVFAQQGLAVHAVASGCSDAVVARMAEEKIAVFQPPKRNLKFDDIVASSNVVPPVKFMRFLHAKARQNKKTIVLPEGTLDRVIKAAAELHEQDLVRLVLIGKKDEVLASARECGVTLSDDIEIVDPKTDPNFEDYANTLYELRKAKGMTPEKAAQLMEDKTFFGTMMVYKGRADGMVSGATTTTADTIRPALQFVKTKPGIKTVSGVFLMSMADRVYLYGDCAVIPNPTTDQLCDVAVASAETARAFGLDPKVAMLSYSTGTSGSGPDVDAVREATEKVRAADPELAVEGPIQYDAAVVPAVAKTKLPNSPVAGHANVFVFPTLNAGNIGYKAVQRASGAIAIGPILQGLKKPVNDLSRGATVADIVNTVIITAIQAQ